MCYNLNPQEKMERMNIQLSFPHFFFPLDYETWFLFYVLQLQTQKRTEHTTPTQLCTHP